MIAKRPWGQPQEVSNSEWPNQCAWTYGMGTELLRDLMLRLERTPRNKAIAVPFDTQGDARRMRNRLYRQAYQKLGRGHISFAIGHRRDGSVALFVRRGHNWGEGNLNEELKRQEASDGN